MRFPRSTVLTLSVVVLATACSSGSGSSPIVTGVSPDGSIVVGGTAPPDTPPPSPVCPADTPVIRSDAANPGIEYFDEDSGLASVHMSQATFECATHVVVVSDADLNRVAVAAVLAGSLRAPLLISTASGSGLLGFETERLAPEQIIAVGDDIVFTAPEWSEVVTLSGDTASIAAQINSLAGFASTIPLPEEIGPATLVTAANALESGAGLIPPATPVAPATTAGGTTSTTVQPTPAEPAEVPSISIGDGQTGVALLVDGNDTAAALAGLASAKASGATAALIDDRDLRMVPGAGRALQSMAVGPGSIQVFGTLTTDSHWQLDVLRFADEIPGGGYLVLPRLLVALYGNPQTPDLGTLGDQGLVDSVARVKDLATRFSAASVPVVPAFEIIASVASGGAGGDGNYSTEWPPETYQPWVDLAAEEGVYVILDLQPGRSDFLTQAQIYEELLINPHVGLALDPEWRLEPDQLHLQQVGHVEAEEVNSVIQWLADLVQEHDLPQKVLLLHQFQLQMLRDRDLIESRPELQVVIQMDGFGPYEIKLDTWDFVTAGWEEDHWAWGWKNFLDPALDSPAGGQTWAELSQHQPEVVYVSYQ